MPKEKEDIKPKAGSPQVDTANRKQSFTVSLSPTRHQALVKKFKTLTLALESIEL